MSISGSITVSSSLSQDSPSSLPGGEPLRTVVKGKFVPVSGTAGTADVVDLKHSRTYSLAAAPTTIDLTSLADVFGASISFARVRTILVINQSTTEGEDLLIGYSSTTANAWSSWLSVPGQISLGASSSKNSGVLFAACPNTAGWVVTSTNKLLTLDPGSASFDVTIEITGSSA